MITRCGIEVCGFWTATFVENLTSRKEAERRFNSFATHVLRKVFEEYIAVPERQNRGAIHYHLAVALAVDIRSGFDFEAYKAARDLNRAGYLGGGQWRPGFKAQFKQAERQYLRSANPALKGIWRIIRKAAPRYRFGRCELIPIYSNSEACARYVGGYVTSQHQNRNPEDRGMRTVRYSLKERAQTCVWNWAFGPAEKWRRGCRAMAALLGGVEDFKPLFGKRWAYHLKDQVFLLADNFVPAMAYASTLPAGMPLESRIVALSRFIAHLRGTLAASPGETFLPSTPAAPGSEKAEGRD